MFLFVYVDIMGTYKPGLIEEIITGEVAGFQITQGWLLGVVIMMSFPALMVFLSLVLKPKANRLTNIIVAIFNIIIVVASLFIDVPWAFYLYGSILEVLLLSLVIWYAWKWSTQEV